jgi:KilA-N domain
MGSVLKFVRPVNGVVVEQRVDNGFVNGTAMSGAHGKRISDWLTTEPIWNLLVALSRRLGIQIKEGWNRNLNASKVSAVFPHLLIVRRGSPLNGGGTWIHPKLAVHLAQWCNTEFALLVSDWIEEWLTTGRNPVGASSQDFEREWQLWQQRYDIRIELKDSLRPELMSSVVCWANKHGVSPIRLCSSVHDAMNERIQGVKAKQIRLLGGLPLGVLLRDYFEASPLISYSAINRIAKNAIIDRDIEPVQAVHEACDHYLGKAFAPSLVPIAENLHSQGRRLKAVKQDKKLKQGVQLDLALWHSNSEPQVS